METEKNYESMKRKELRQCLKEAREREEEERKILDSAEAFGSDYEKKQKQYRTAYEEVETIKKEISERNKKFKVIGILLLLLVIGIVGFLHKTGIRRWQMPLENGEYEDVYDVAWWPGVDFSFTVYEDHVCIGDCNRSDIEYITIPETIWFKPVTELNILYFSEYYINSEKIVFSDNIDNINDENGRIARVREKLLRWGEEGITAYLTDMGVEDIEAVKERLIFTEQEIASISSTNLAGKATREEVREAIDIMINGGDIKHIPDYIYMKVKFEINQRIRTLDLNLDYWL